MGWDRTSKLLLQEELAPAALFPTLPFCSAYALPVLAYLIKLEFIQEVKHKRKIPKAAQPIAPGKHKRVDVVRQKEQPLRRQWKLNNIKHS